MAGAKTKEKRGNCSIRSPSSQRYSDSEKLTICILYEYIKSVERVAEYCGIEASSVRYIIKNNKKIRERAAEIVLSIAESETAEFAERLRNRALEAVETLLTAVTSSDAIAKSNSQQLSIAMATLMDKFSLIPTAEQGDTSGGVIVLPQVAETDKASA